MLGWKLVTLVERVRMSHDDTLSSGAFRVNNAHTIANGLAILGMGQVHERVFLRKVNSKAALEDKGRGIAFDGVGCSVLLIPQDINIARPYRDLARLLPSGHPISAKPWSLLSGSELDDGTT